VVSYALLSGWWCAMYVDRVGQTTLSAVPLCVLFYVIYGCISAILGISWLAHDRPDFSVYELPFLVAGAAIFVSPIVVNWALQPLLTRVSKEEIS